MRFEDVFRLEESKEKGRFVTCIRDFEVGDVLWREHAALSAPWNEEVCIGCSKSAPHLASSCHVVRTLFPPVIAVSIAEMEDALASVEGIEAIDRARCLLLGIAHGYEFDWEALSDNGNGKKKKKKKKKKKAKAKSSPDEGDGVTVVSSSQMEEKAQTSVSAAEENSSCSTKPVKNETDNTQNNEGDVAKDDDEGMRNVLNLRGGTMDVAREAVSAIRSSSLLSPMLRLLRRKGDDSTSRLSPEEVDEAVATLLSILNTNSHELSGDLGTGVFPFAAMMEHNCDPNASFTTNGDLLWVCATKPIRKGDVVSIDYIESDIYLPVNERRELLLSSHGFLCTCECCVSRPDRCRAFRCPSCNEKSGGVVYPTGDGSDLSTWKCDSCGSGISQGTLDSFLKHEKLFISKLHNRELDPIAGDDEQLTHAMGCLHDYHYGGFWARHDEARRLTDLRQGKEALVLWSRVVEALEHALPKFHTEKVVFYDMMAQICLLAGDREGMVQAFHNSLTQSRVVSGVDAPGTRALEQLVSSPPQTLEELAAVYDIAEKSH